MRKEKQLLLDEVKRQIEERQSFVIMSYFELDAIKTTGFRRTVSEMGGEFEVVKKRILVKAAKEAGVELDIKELKGHVGIVLSGKDAIQTTKEVFKLKKENDKSIAVLGGYFEGRLYNAKDIETLSQLPSKDEMRAQLLAVLEAPMAQTAAVMQSALCSVMYCLENKAKKESSN